MISDFWMIVILALIGIPSFVVYFLYGNRPSDDEIEGWDHR